MDNKKQELFFKQKALLDGFLERRAISKAQYDKSFGDLLRKMGPEIFECWNFMGEDPLSDELSALVCEGKKRATTSALQAYEAEGEALPEKGTYSIILSASGEPRAWIRTTDVLVMKFSEMTFEICKEEGEDECLETWKDTHFSIFTEEGIELGYQFTADSPIVFERFELLYVL